MKWIIRVGVVALILFGLNNVLHRVMRKYEMHKLDVVSAERIDKLPADQQRTAALAVYLSFFWGNTTLLPAMCKEQGVDLSSYSLAFKERYSDGHSQAREALTRLGHSEQALIAAVASTPEPRSAFTAMLKKIGNDVGKGDSVVEGCHALEHKQADMLDFMNFREIFPTVWQRTELR
ncbi:hypothetical protein FIV34_01315 [Luteibacter pinisoli]|uniref:Uncharacterized protein n=1 Tax=Luteibacter pinisoli TaxID=2589080 RepID=A0A4Y5YY68_9GAMM|nr:hypothetical protein [Luteibacter pinisoli]QDE37932.1 hypothetical protein FIV34_01315 [Luteibacter pinisoli]